MSLHDKLESTVKTLLSLPPLVYTSDHPRCSKVERIQDRNQTPDPNSRDEELTLPIILDFDQQIIYSDNPHLNPLSSHQRSSDRKKKKVRFRTEIIRQQNDRSEQNENLGYSHCLKNRSGYNCRCKPGHKIYQNQSINRHIARKDITDSGYRSMLYIIGTSYIYRHKTQ